MWTAISVYVFVFIIHNLKLIYFQYGKCPQGRLAIRADTNVPALCVEDLKPLHSPDLSLKYGRIPP